MADTGYNLEGFSGTLDVISTCFLISVSNGMSFVLDEVPPHPPRLGVGGVARMEAKCVTPRAC